MVAIVGLIFNFVTNQSLITAKLTGRTDLLNQFVNPKTAHLVPKKYHQILRSVLYDGLHMAFLMTIILVIISFVVVVYLVGKKSYLNDLK